MRTDKELLDWLGDPAQQGCALISDDRGHWAVSDFGMQEMAEGDGPQDYWGQFGALKHQWRNTVREAINASIDEDESED